MRLDIITCLPRLLEKADSINHQRVAVPMSARIAVEGWFQIFRMAAAVHKELPVHMSVTFEQHQHKLRCGEKRGVVRGGARRSSWQAARFEIFRSAFCLAIGDDLSRPGLEGPPAAAATARIGGKIDPRARVVAHLRRDPAVELGVARA